VRQWFQDGGGGLIYLAQTSNDKVHGMCLLVLGDWSRVDTKPESDVAQTVLSLHLTENPTMNRYCLPLPWSS